MRGRIWQTFTRILTTFAVERCPVTPPPLAAYPPGPEMAILEAISTAYGPRRAAFKQRRLGRGEALSRYPRRPQPTFAVWRPPGRVFGRTGQVGHPPTGHQPEVGDSVTLLRG